MSHDTIKKVAIAAAAAGGLYFLCCKLGLIKGCCGCGSSSANKIDIIVISGPAGVGKGTLIERIKAEHPGAFSLSVSHTSRGPRAGEKDGVHYHFSDKETMNAMEQKGEFLEICNVHGNLYGTSFAALDAVKKAGNVCIIECDVQGSQKIKAAFAKQAQKRNVAYMFIAPPSMEELEARMKKRGSEDEEKMKRRLETAKSEMSFLESNRSHFDTVLVNDDLEATYKKFSTFLGDRGAF